MLDSLHSSSSAINARTRFHATSMASSCVCGHEYVAGESYIWWSPVWPASNVQVVCLYPAFPRAPHCVPVIEKANVDMYIIPQFKLSTRFFILVAVPCGLADTLQPPREAS